MPTSSQSTQSGFVAPVYRPDIDGLRAVAVLMVLAFHFFPRAAPGGFVGVDVFFVISGFLITKLIAGEMATRRFSIAVFYARRARRIFPALALVMTATLGAGWILLLPSQYGELGRQALAAAGFVSNLALFADTGYFQAAATRNPLLHLWSLGVEEQFYLIWPLLLFVVTPHRLRLAVTLTIVVSFVCNIALVGWDPIAAFYLPVSRFWEMAIGGWLALADASVPAARTRRRSEVESFFGVALLAGSLAILRADSAFPGWWAVAPVTGAAMIIQAGPHAWVNRVLSSRLCVAIGLISYPVYLWHWPLVTLARIARFGVEPPLLMKAGLIAAAFALAYLTYRFIETPIRSGRKTLTQTGIASASLAAVAVIAFAIMIGKGFPDRFPLSMERLLRDFTHEIHSASRFRKCFLDAGDGAEKFTPACAGEGRPEARVVMVWGDSQAGHLRPGLDAIATPDIRIAQYTAAGCAPVAEYTSVQPNCRPVNQAILARIATLRPDTVILSARWSIYRGGEFARVDWDELRATVRKLRALGVRRIVLIGEFPSWKLSPAEFIVRQSQLAVLRGVPFVAPDRTAASLDLGAFEVDHALRSVAADEQIDFIAPYDRFCSVDGCLLFVPGQDGEPTAWDRNHLTPAAAAYFARGYLGVLTGR